MGLFKRLFSKPTVQIEVGITHELVESPRMDSNDLYRKTCPKMQIYKIRGRSCETKRLRTIRKVALDSADRDKIISFSGLYDVQTFETIEKELPTEAQINYATDLGIALSDKYSKNDLSCLISRMTGDTDRDDMIPVELNLAKLAAEHNVYLSEFSGEKRALNCLWSQLSEDEKILFFIFCVHQNILNDCNYNLRHTPYLDLYECFVRDYRDDQQLLRSLSNYVGSDLSLHKEPNRQRNAYKIASEYLTK